MTGYKDKTVQDTQQVQRAAAMRENLKRRKEQQRERKKDEHNDTKKREH